MHCYAALKLLLICALTSEVSSARIRQRVRDPTWKGDLMEKYDEQNCEKDLMDTTSDLADRITQYMLTCGVTDDHLIYSDGETVEDPPVVTVNDEGKELLCEKKCQDLEDWQTDVPASDELIKACHMHVAEDEFMGIIMHDAYDKARKACLGDEAPLIDEIEEDETTTSTFVEPEVDVPVEDETTTTSTFIEPEVPVTKPEVIEIPDGAGSPVAPLKGNKIKQMKFEYELKDALSMRSQPTCKTLMKIYKQCDYKGTNKVYLKQIDNMLDKLVSEKVESMKLLTELYAKVGKDPESDPMTFKDWTLFKMGKKEANKCLLEYAGVKTKK